MVLVSVNSVQGRREYMEDRYAYHEKDGIIVAMVCDGHGGFQVAAKTANSLPHRIMDALKQFSGSHVKNAEAIRNAILEWGSEMKNHHSGSTLTGVAIKNDIVYVYNIGDSRTCAELNPRSIVYRLSPLFNLRNGNFIDTLRVDFTTTNFVCTTDHDGYNNDESARVRASGGQITGERLNGILSVTRALGDGDIGPGISFTPDIYWFKQKDLADPIVMYSDGIYELQRYRSNADFSDKYLYQYAINNGAEALVQYAYKNGSDDNLTTMIVDSY